MVVRFDDAGNILPEDALKWARSVAGEWGDINQQKKVKAPGLPGPAWWFDCSGHGGYLLVSSLHQVPEALHSFAADGVPTWDKGWAEVHGDSYNNITVFCFEEDCNWAAFEIAYPEVARWSVYDREKGWAKNPSIFNDGKEEPLDIDRSLLAKRRLKDPVIMEMLIEQQIDSARKSIRQWQDKEVAEKLLGAA